MSKNLQGQCFVMGEDDLFPPLSLFVHENATLKMLPLQKGGQRMNKHRCELSKNKLFPRFLSSIRKLQCEDSSGLF